MYMYEYMYVFAAFDAIFDVVYIPSYYSLDRLSIYGTPPLTFD